jgi:hypothetical protein
LLRGIADAVLEGHEMLTEGGATSEAAENGGEEKSEATETMEADSAGENRIGRKRLPSEASRPTAPRPKRCRKNRKTRRSSPQVNLNKIKSIGAAFTSGTSRRAARFNEQQESESGDRDSEGKPICRRAASFF